MIAVGLTARGHGSGHVARALAGLGFTAAGSGRYRRDDLTVEIGRGWLTLVAGADAGAEPAAEADGSAAALAAGPDVLDESPGLWKRPDGTRRVFEAPLPLRLDSVRADEAGDEFDDDLPAEARGLVALVTWALDTLDGTGFEGKGPAGWSGPDHAAVVAMLPRGEASLSLRSGRLLERVSICEAPGRLALRVDLARLGTAVETMPAPRAAWLRRLLADARALRFVRVGRTAVDGGAERVQALVDLAGAPPALLPALVTSGLAALEHCFTWMAATLAVVADPLTASRLLDEVAPAA